MKASVPLQSVHLLSWSACTAEQIAGEEMEKPLFTYHFGRLQKPEIEQRTPTILTTRHNCWLLIHQDKRCHMHLSRCFGTFDHNGTVSVRDTDKHLWNVSKAKWLRREINTELLRLTLLSEQWTVNELN